VFSDADVMFVRGINPLLRHVRAHRFAAMVERWHQSLYAIYRQAPEAARRALGHLFHGPMDVRQMRQTRYYNTGLMLCRRDEHIHAAVKDVLMASILYPDLTRQVHFPEQTLLNLAMMVRGVRCRDLYGLCVPSYHDERHGWPPPVVRHYLGDSLNRRPAALSSRHGQWVDQALDAIGISVAELKDQGAWETVPLTGPVLSPYPF
jgi:lipopolysaccharide biosynthesis glycosyltransferase